MIFNCPARGIGTDDVRVSANSDAFGYIAVSDEFCDYLVRGCAVVPISLLSESISLSFNKLHQSLYIAEIIFFSSSSHHCSPVCPLNTAVGSTSKQTPTLPSNQENSSAKDTFPQTSLSKTSEKTKSMENIMQDFTTSQTNISTNNDTSFSHIPSSSKAMLTQG